jgi:hypothetical protein
MKPIGAPLLIDHFPMVPRVWQEALWFGRSQPEKQTNKQLVFIIDYGVRALVPIEHSLLIDNHFKVNVHNFVLFLTNKISHLVKYMNIMQLVLVQWFHFV